jgi:putative endonuclease
MISDPYFVYVLECSDGSLYTGIATDLEKRLAEHKSGKGAKYTRAKGVKKILYSEKHTNKSEALKRELQLKGWTRQKKLALINEKIKLTEA